jgi:5-bromo-4-chloroindolyl phosphate hydrolysis protein
MNDLIIQTIIFESITLLSVIGVLVYIRKNQSAVYNTTSEEVEKKLEAKEEELSLAKENNANIRTELAAAQSSLTHFSKLEDHSNTLEQQSSTS